MTKESHLRDFMTAAEPKHASSIKLSELSGREIRRAFYGYFKQPPGRRPERRDEFLIVLLLTQLLTIPAATNSY